MGKVSISGVGGAGAGSDECTATRAEVLKGFTAITYNSNDEVVGGTLELTGDAADSQVLAGKSFYKTNPKDKRIGTMSNCGAASATLNAGESYSIPAGYHNGGGKITTNSLANQTPGNATASKIISGYSAYVNGARIDGTLGVQSILSFNAAVYSSTAIMINWQNPTIGPFAGIRVVYKTGGYPTSMYDGTLCYQGPGNNYNPLGTSSALVDGFTPGVTYYFRACGFSAQDGSLWLNNSTFTAGVSTTRGQQVFTDSGVFIVPDGVRSIDVFCVGGGASGGYGVSSSSYAMRGGSSGRTATVKGINVSPGQQFAVAIGAGGTGDKSLVYSGNATSFGNNLVTAAGGVRWGVSTVGNGGSGEGGRIQF
ncbi:glycine-rich domain-containing protein [Lacrimispora xylanisolvens]|uniref:glycine-rich domain-containing protein n=1 Tax=Lacrimispora xylanisolvens TaxID=384636 RepID=UPI002402AEE8